MKTKLILVALLTSTLEAFAQETTPLVTWTDTVGHTMQAGFGGLSGETVNLIIAGSPKQVPLSRLSPASQEQARKMAATIAASGGVPAQQQPTGSPPASHTQRRGENNGALLGESVAVDGPLMAAAAPGLGHGEVKVFNTKTGELLHTITNPRTKDASVFGLSVALSGNRLVVGSRNKVSANSVGVAYVYDLAGSTPTVPVVTLNTPEMKGRYFGHSVGIDGSRVIVGAGMSYDYASAGVVYVYDLKREIPDEPVAMLKAPQPKPNDCFGESLAISGTRVAVGSRGGNKAYVFDLESPTPTVPAADITNSRPGLDREFGRSVAISGSIVVVGTEARDVRDGAVHVYDLASGKPNLVTTFERSAEDKRNSNSGGGYGKVVGILGSRVAVGAPYVGEPGCTVFIYDIKGMTPAVPVLRIKKPDRADDDKFGWSLGMSGTSLVVGSPFDDTNYYNAGNAYVYDFGSLNPESPAVAVYTRQPGAAPSAPRSEWNIADIVRAGETGRQTGQTPSVDWDARFRSVRQSRIDDAVATSRRLNEERQAQDAAAVGAGTARGLDRATGIINPPRTRFGR